MLLTHQQVNVPQAHGYPAGCYHTEVLIATDHSQAFYHCVRRTTTASAIAGKTSFVLRGVLSHQTHRIDAFRIYSFKNEEGFIPWLLGDNR